MKEQDKTTSEDYLDNLLNSIMNGDSSSQTSNEDFGSLDDSLNDIEDELFGDIEDTDLHIIDEDDYFGKEISDAELFGLDDDIMSVIEDAPKANMVKADTSDIDEMPLMDNANEEELEFSNEAGKIHEIIKEDDVEDAINVNDSAADDDLQGLLDVMGISNDSDIPNEESEDKPKKKKRKGLFGGKKKEKVKKEKEVYEDYTDVSEPQEMMDLSALSGFSSSEDSDSSDFSFASGEDTIDMGTAMNFGSMDLDLNFNDDVSEEKTDDSSMGDMLNDDFSLYNPSVADETDEEDGDDKESKKGKKGKKDKKEKKEKKKKDKKGKKPAKKSKPRKEPKVKAKEPDEYIKISKLGMFLAFSFVFVFIILVVFGGDYYTYNRRISKATKEYVAKNYTVAYDTIFGLELKKNDDVELFNQIQTVMFVNRHYEAYKNLIRMNEYEQGLYSLLKGVKMFDKYQNTGRELNCYDDMQDVLGWIDKGLLETYGLSESQAREMNLMSNDYELAVKVHEIAAKAREKAEAEKEEANKATQEQTEASKENENDSNN